MSVQIFQAQYDTLETIFQRFMEQAVRTQQMTQAVQNGAEKLTGGDWKGRGVAAFDSEIANMVLPGLDRLSTALEQAGSTTRDVAKLIQAAEVEAASPFSGGQAEQLLSSAGTATANAGSDSTTSSNSASFVDRFLSVATSIVDVADKLDDFLPIPAAIVMASALRTGTTYAGQVLVRTPTWLRRIPQVLQRAGLSGRQLVGVADNLSHIKGANMARHIAKGARKIPLLGWAIAAGQATTSVGNVWNENWDEYSQMNSAERASAMSVDAGLAVLPVAGEVAGGIAGIAAGSQIGGAIGGAIGGFGGPFAIISVPAGAAAGAFIGGAVGGFLGDWLGGKAGEIASDKIQAAGGRDTAVEFLTDNVTQPIANGINSAIDEIQSWRLPAVDIPSFGFSW